MSHLEHIGPEAADQGILDGVLVSGGENYQGSCVLEPVVEVLLVWLAQILRLVQEERPRGVAEDGAAVLRPPAPVGIQAGSRPLVVFPDIVQPFHARPALTATVADADAVLAEEV